MVVNNNEGQDVIKIEPVESRISFIRKNDLTRMLKKVEKSTDKALDFLEAVMMDEENDLKTRVQAAQYLVDKRVQISDNISKDALSRCIAESRMVLAMQATQQRVSKFAGSGNAEEDEDEDAQPVYVPNMILKNDHISQM